MNEYKDEARDALFLDEVDVDDDERTAELTALAQGDGPLAAVAAEALAIRRDRLAAEAAERFAAEVFDFRDGSTIYERLDRGELDRADLTALLRTQQAAEQSSFENRRLDDLRRSMTHDGYDRAAVEAAVEARKVQFERNRSFDPIDALLADPGYQAHERAKADAATERHLAEQALRERLGAFDGYEMVDGRGLVRTADLVAEALAVCCGRPLMSGEYCWPICKTAGRTECRSCAPQKYPRKSLRDPITGRLREPETVEPRRAPPER